MSLKVSQTLTNYAAGLSQDLANGSIADFLCPAVQVATAVGKYKIFDTENDFKVPDTRRGVGSNPTIVGMYATDGDYNCKPHALEGRVDMHEKDEWGENDPLGIYRLKTRSIVTQAKLAKEARIIAAAKTVSAEGGKGSWSGTSNTNDPVAEIDAVLEAIATAAGKMPNRLAIGLPAWRIIRSNPQVLKRFPGADKIGINQAQFASLLLNPSIEIRVGVLSGSNKKEGTTGTKTNLLGSELFAFIGQDTASVDDPSFMKCFQTRSGSVDSVRTYMADNGLWEGIIVNWSEDVQVTGSATGKRITVS